jgi:hypothetical protein
MKNKVLDLGAFATPVRRLCHIWTDCRYNALYVFSSRRHGGASGSGCTYLVQAQAKVLDQYCINCHNEDDRVANLAIDKLDTAHVGKDAQTWEKVVRKLRAGMMPPAGNPRPIGQQQRHWFHGWKTNWTRQLFRTCQPPGPASFESHGICKCHSRLAGSGN